MTIISPLPNQIARQIVAHPAAGSNAGAENGAGHERQAKAGSAANMVPNAVRFSLGGRDSIVLSDAALTAYAKEAGAALPEVSFGSSVEAAKFLEDVLGRMVASAEKIKGLVQARQALHRPEVVAEQGEARIAQVHAFQVGQQLAAEKDLQRLSAALSKAFGLDQPIYQQDGGLVSFNQLDFSFAGRLLAQLMPDGRAHLLLSEDRHRAAPTLAASNTQGLWAWLGGGAVTPSPGFGAGVLVAVVVIGAFWFLS
jgi:hypothetical protein